MRYAAYIRISSDDQVGNFSIDAQQRAIEAWIADNDGALIAAYIDEARLGYVSAETPVAPGSNTLTLTSTGRVVHATTQ